MVSSRELRNVHTKNGSAAIPGVRESTGDCRPDTLDALIDRTHRAGVERQVALARLGASMALLIVILVGTGPFHPPIATTISGVYVLYSVVLLAALWRSTSGSARLALTLHVVDVAWATASTLSSGGLGSHSFMLFLYTLAVAAFRWGFSGAVINGAVVVAITVGEGIDAAAGHGPWAFELDHLLGSALSVALIAVLFGLVAGRIHSLGAQAIAFGELMTRIAGAHRLGPAVRETLRQLEELFRARQAVLVTQQVDEMDAYLWRLDRNAPGDAVLSCVQLSRADRDLLFFHTPDEARTWEYSRGPRRREAATGALDASGSMTSQSVAVPAALAERWRCDLLTVMIVDVPGCWSGRLFLLDPTHPRSVILRLALLHRFVGNLMPSLVSVYLLRRLRSRAEASERARLARELHDGIIQTLAALELRIEASRRRAAATDRELADDLQHTHDLLHSNLVDVRELIQQLTPSAGDVRQLPYELRDLLERFARTSTIEANLRWTTDRTDLTPRQCREVFKIVQEALVNVRRHSGASRVTVSVGADAAGWELIIADDGCGFPIAGRWTHDQLEERKEGPRIIRERVAALGGSLQLDSSPAGATLEITFPGAHRDR